MASSHHIPQQYAQPNGHPASYPAQSQNLLEQFTKAKEDLWLQLGCAFESANDNGSALDAFHRALAMNSYNVDALRHIASILRAEDKYDRAVEYIQNILKIHPQDGEAFSSLGHCFLMMDELQQAYTAYQSALYNLRDPKEPKLWYGIGILYDRYGSLDHAEEAFTQVMRMAPDFDKANEIYFRLGIIYKQQSKYEQSLACFKYIVDSPPNPLNQTDIWFQIGHVYEQQKDYESAKAAYLKVLERDAFHAKVLQQLGWLHHQQSTDYNSQEQAIEYLEKSVSSDQTDAQSWYLLGRCYMSQHKFPKAYEAYQQAVYRDGRNPTFWCSIGVLYYQINQYRDALDAYSRAIRLNPNISEVWYDLGTLYESCNNQTNDALDAYNRAAELDPHNPQIKARVQLLRSGQSSQMGGGHPHPQDVPPQAYQPTGASGATHSQWGGVPTHHAPQQPPPPPLNAGSDWNQRPGDVHGGPPQPQSHAPPPQLVHSYDARQEATRPTHAPRPPSPRIEPTRRPDSYGHSSLRRQRSPSPRSRHPIPTSHRSAQSMSSSGPAQLQQHQHQPHQLQPQHQPAPPPPPPPAPNRISNPNYGPQHPLPTSSGMPPSSGHSQNHLPPYSRGGVGTPPPSHVTGPDVAPLHPDRLRSPRSTYSHHPAQPSFHHHNHHHESQGHSNIASGAPPPTSAAVAAEAAAREREREERPESQPHASKRFREWDDRDGLVGVQHKKMANEEARAKLEDPNSSRIASPPSQPTKVERERHERVPTSVPAPISMMSPEATKRAEEVRRAEENYRPSAVAHQPAPLSTVLSQSTQKPPEEAIVPAPAPPATAPEAISSARMNGHELTQPKPEPERRAEPAPVPVAPIAAPEPEPTPMEVDEDTKMVHQPPPPPPPVEEPAARKMEVDENYDEESADEAKATQAAEEPRATSAARNQDAAERTPDAAPLMSNEHAVPSGEPASVEANA